MSAHVQAIIRRVPEQFPEPEFSNIQRAVFEGNQQDSLALAQMLLLERGAPIAVEAASVSHAPMVRFGAYSSDQLIGWSSGWLERGGYFYMANSGVLPQHRRQGIYTALLDAVLSYAREVGAQVVRSQHSVLNNQIIVCKLRRGFHITGLSASTQMGSLVELAYHLSEPRFQLFRSRVIPWVVPQDDV